VGTRERGVYPEDRLGLGEGLREEALDGIPNRVFPVMETPVAEPSDGVRLWGEGKLLILLWTTGDGPRSPTISDVPSLLGRDGRRAPVDGGG
jgi:hypothetical protein